MYNKSESRYMTMIRIGAFGVSVFLWLLSILWSADGFGIKLEDWKVAGYGLALSVTIVQLIFNRGTMNPTLFFGGLAAYAYGIATNLIGLFGIIGVSFSSEQWSVNPVDTLISTLLIFALAFVVEVLPESLLLWSLNPDQGSPGDFISSLFQGSGLNKGKNKQQNRPNMSNSERIDPRFFIDPRQTNQQTKNSTQTYKPTNLPTYQPTNSQTNPFSRVNWSSLSEKSKLILVTAQRLWEQTHKISPTEISRAIYQTSKQKGFVSQVLRENKVRY